jgi:hypothetical protein
MRAMAARANSPRIVAYLQRSRDRRSAMKRSGEEVERNLRKASTVLRRANGNGNGHAKAA